MNRVVPLDPRVNPGYLKLDLYCRGLRLHESCNDDEDGRRPLLRTRAGLGSGLELILPGGLWTNVPAVEDFAKESPYELRRKDNAAESTYWLFRDGEALVEVTPAPRPSWYDRETSSGRVMRRVGTLQGTYLGVYPSQVCDFWRAGEEGSGAPRVEKENCRFCSVGLNLGGHDADGKSVDEVLEVVHAAWRESKITYVDFNTGHHDALDYLDILEPYLRRVKSETDLLIGVQSPPHPDLGWYRRLKELGVNRVSFCFEFFNPESFEELCPGKHRSYGLDRYLQAIEHCASLGVGSGLTLSPWVTNGEIIAGLEPVQSSLDAIDWLTERGAIPTVCVFRPLQGTDLARHEPPRTEDMVPIFQRLYTRCMEKELPIGLAPNINVSLVMLPEECRWLVQDQALLDSLRGKERKRLSKKKVFALGRGVKRALFGPRVATGSAAS